MNYKQGKLAIEKQIDKYLLDVENQIFKEFKAQQDLTLQAIQKYYSNFLIGVDPSNYYTTLSLYNRMQGLEKEIKAIYTKLNSNVYRLTYTGQEKIFEESYLRNRYINTFFTSAKYQAPNNLIKEISITGDVELVKKIKDIELRRQAQGYISKAGATLSTIIKDNNQASLTKVYKVLKNGLINGTSYSKQAIAIKSEFGKNAYNAIRVTRTEGNRNASAGAFENTQDLKAQGLEITRQWLATLDGRTRDSHARLDGQFEDKNGLFWIDGDSARYPGDFADVAENINCFTGETLVMPNDIQKVYKRHYSGNVLTIKTSRGVEFTVTPNHPIATCNGWVSAKSLNVGDDVLSVFSSVEGKISQNNIDYKPTSFTKVFDFFRIIFSVKNISATTKQNFHGDFGDSDVNIVSTNGKLINRTVSKFPKIINNGNFTLSYVLKVLLFCYGSFRKFCTRPFFPSNRIMGILRKSLSFFRGSISHSDKHTLRASSGSDVVFSKNSIDNLPTDIVNFCKSLDGSTTNIGIDNITSINASVFSGHIYNLQTVNSMYIIAGKSYNGNSIIAHNCRCSVIDIVKGVEPTLRRGIDPVTGKSDILSFQSYDEWLVDGIHAAQRHDLVDGRHVEPQ